MEEEKKVENRSISIDEYDKLYKVPIIACELCGIRLMKNDSYFASLCWRLYYWVFFWGCFLSAIQEAISMVITYRNGNAKDIFLMMPCIGFILVALAKSIKMIRHRSVFENLIVELRTIWPVEELTSQEYNLISSMIKQLTIILKGYFVCNTFLFFFFTSAPIVQYARRLMGHDVPLILGFSYWFPFDSFQPVYYEIIVVVQTLETYNIILFMVVGDLFLFTYLSTITTYFYLLALRIARIIYVPVDEQLPADYPLGSYSKALDKNRKSQLFTTTDVNWESVHLKEIKEIVLRHQSLIRLSENVENMYSFSLLINFINISIIICFCGFCSVFLEKWNEVKYKIFFVSAIFQVWLLSWYGQKLLDSSAMVAAALYESGWYNASKRLKSSILIMLIRAQKEVHITTYGFSIICLESFTTIIKTSWSYFTLLMNTYET